LSSQSPPISSYPTILQLPSSLQMMSEHTSMPDSRLTTMPQTTKHLRGATSPKHLKIPNAGSTAQSSTPCPCRYTRCLCSFQLLSRSSDSPPLKPSFSPSRLTHAPLSLPLLSPYSLNGIGCVPHSSSVPLALPSLVISSSLVRLLLVLHTLVRSSLLAASIPLLPLVLRGLRTMSQGRRNEPLHVRCKLPLGIWAL